MSHSQPDKFEQLVQRLAGELPEPLFRHTLEVTEMAGRLAEHHASELVERTRLAALLHDNCKHWAPEKLADYARKLGREEELEAALGNPKLLHAIVGAMRVREDYGISDPEIELAVRFHTTGSPRLTTLGRILFCADKVSEDRKYPEVELLRDYAFTHLGIACYEIVRRTLVRLLELETLIAPESVEFYNSLLREQYTWES